MINRENYDSASFQQRMIAVAGCVLGGLIVVGLGFLAAFGGYESLAKAGYGIVTIPAYALVMLCGIGILFRVPYAVYGALGLTAIEIVYSLVTVFLVTTTDVSFLFLAKVAVILCCSQLFVATVVNADEEEDEHPQRRAIQRPQNGVPQPRHNGRQMAPGPQNRSGNRNPPQARR